MDGMTPETGSDISQAAAQIESLLARRDTPVSQRQADQLPPSEAEADDEAPPEDDSAAGVSEGSDEGTPTDDEPEQDPAAKRKLKVGDQDLDEEEVVKGYLRQADYTRKTQEAAEQRKAAQAQLQAISDERARYAQALDFFSQQLPRPVEPDPALLDSDPVEFLKQREAYERGMTKVQALEHERGLIEQQRQQDNARKFAERRQAEEALLLERLPEWGDPGKAKEGKAQVAKFLMDAGYSDHDLSQLVDHRSVLIARDAMLYRQMMARKPAVENKARNAPPVLKPGGAKPGGSEAEALKQANDRLKKTGNVHDAASAILAMQRKKS